jgi:DNA-binding NarL/FixJ family response regulator
MNTTSTRVLIVEDHELSRVGLSVALKRSGAVHVIGEATNGQEAIHMANQLKPDLILMDIGLPLIDGINATKTIKQNNPDIKVVMLTSHDTGNEVLASLSSGADAYCLKDIKLERLMNVIESVMDGAIWLDPAVAAFVTKALNFNQPTKMSKASNPESDFGLTQRELEVLSKIVEGKSNKEIGEELFITIHTVKAHVCNIIQKLSVDDRTQAAVKAIQDGLIQDK